jgi:hypothetical protein
MSAHALLTPHVRAQLAARRRGDDVVVGQLGQIGPAIDAAVVRALAAGVVGVVAVVVAAWWLFRREGGEAHGDQGELASYGDRAMPLPPTIRGLFHGDVSREAVLAMLAPMGDPSIALAGPLRIPENGGP